MEFYLNELSLQGQFPSLDGFYSTFSDLMRMRFVLRSVGKELYCSRKFEYMRVFADVSLREAVQRLSRDQQRVVLPWVRQNGPFWDDSRLHTEDDYIECLGHVVTGTGLAEAASIAEAGIMTSVVSASPSVWEVSPLIVRWRQDDHSDFENMIENYWTLNSLQSSLTREPTPLRTWDDLESECRKVCSQLTFSDDAFEPLHGHPFIPAAAKRILFLLKQLQDLKNCLRDEGGWTQEGYDLHRILFTGDNPPFSDSSDTEKNEFRTQLTFAHPRRHGEDLFCTFHGKVRSSTKRIHYHWSMTPGDPIYVVYIGDKLTKR